MTKPVSLPQKVFNSPVLGSLALDYCSFKDLVKATRVAKCFQKLLPHLISKQYNRQSLTVNDLTHFVHHLKISRLDVLNRMSRLETIEIPQFLNPHVLGCRYAENWKNVTCAVVDEKQLIAIAVRCPSLEYLYLKTPCAISNETLLRFSKLCPHLKGIELHCSRFNFDHKGLAALCTNCKNLESLHIHGYNEYPTELAHAIAAFGKNLKSLSLSSFQMIDLEEILVLVARNCPNLTHLQLNNIGMSYNGLAILAIMKNLEVLILQRKVTRQIADFTNPFESYIEFDSDHFKRLVDLCPNLRLMQISHNWLTEAERSALKAYASKNPKLEIK